MKIIIGLGNPGRQYEDTRHNAGFMVVDKFAEKHGVDISKARFNALLGEVFVNGEKIVLVKPMTYMNNSGQAVGEVLNFYKPDLEDIIVVVDDIEIELGMLRIRAKNGKGTHNGLKSIFAHLKTDDYAKMKLGVGKFKRDMDLADFVLARPSKEDDEVIDDLIDRAVDALDEFTASPIDIVMNKFNGSVLEK
ncbi:aminoacyl-tRNA hydrolase [uncultured Ezakiella sp.]|uniref:aminoacyl-tRNA hydrolase n=1 Tax=uncultured Ezakiella sp. TaxID=1637529 RepID=UPI0025E237DE|nr:aminoacyl-tRNA hydrolase [uncultured Ezakiella sp.]